MKEPIFFSLPVRPEAVMDYRPEHETSSAYVKELQAVTPRTLGRFLKRWRPVFLQQFGRRSSAARTLAYKKVSSKKLFHAVRSMRFTRVPPRTRYEKLALEVLIPSSLLQTTLLAMEYGVPSSIAQTRLWVHTQPGWEGWGYDYEYSREYTRE
jgi:hypothetical protein